VIAAQRSAPLACREVEDAAKVGLAQQRSVIQVVESLSARSRLPAGALGIEGIARDLLVLPSLPPRADAQRWAFDFPGASGQESGSPCSPLSQCQRRFQPRRALNPGASCTLESRLYGRF